MAKLEKARLFVPITKVDVAQRLVFGRITEEAVDKANEIFDYESSKPFFEKWSDNIAKASGGKSLGNVRAMHGAVAAGKLVSIDFDDTAKAIDCCAKIVDDAEWKKVEEGVYTGFSMGGAYVKRWDEPGATGVKRYTANPSEVSIVDNPCVHKATFTMTKADGAEVEVPFVVWAPTNDEVAAKAVDLAKAAGAEDTWPDRLDEARDALVAEKAAAATEDEDEEDDAEGDDKKAPKEGGEAADGAGEAEKAASAEDAPAAPIEDWGIDQVFKVRADGSTHATKGAAKRHADALQAIQASGDASPLALALAKAHAAAKAATAEEGAATAGGLVTDGLEDALAALQGVSKLADGNAELKKSLSGVGRLAELIQSLVYVQNGSHWEREHEKDDSPIPEKLAEAINSLGAVLIEMAKEELAEAMAEMKVIEPTIEVVFVECADMPDITKAQAFLDMVKADAALAEKVEKRFVPMPEGEAAEKLAAAEERVEKLQKQIDEALPGIETLGSELAKATARIATLEAQPAPMPGLAPGSKVVEKGADAAVQPGVNAANAAQVLKGLVDTMGQDKVRDMLFDAALSTPMRAPGG